MYTMQQSPLADDEAPTSTLPELHHLSLMWDVELFAGLGSLVCLWMALRKGPGAAFCVAGRTGRAALLTTRLLTSSGACIHMARCDVGCSEDARTLCSRLSAGPLTKIVHAGLWRSHCLF